MRYLSALLAGTALGAALYFIADPALRAQDRSNPIFAIFDSDRSLISHGSMPDPAVVAALENSPIAKTYYTIQPQRSLLAYNCADHAGWCSQTAFSFQSLFVEAASLGNRQRPDPNALALDWYRSLTTLDSGILQEPAQLQSLDRAPFQLLAIVNRMDLAQRIRDTWRGAEIHFVYGLIPKLGAGAPQNLTVILEFELRSFDAAGFKNLAQTWADLSDVPQSQYAAKLRDALRSSGFSLDSTIPTRTIRVRSRINHQLGPNWRFSQLVLDPAAQDPAARTAFAPANLNDQISREVVRSKTFQELWYQATLNLAAGNQYPIPDKWQERPTVEYILVKSQGMAMLQGICNAGLSVRDMLAMEQCTWCHTTETGTLFTHIPNRLAVNSSVPSAFLIGSDPMGSTIHPRLTDLYYGNEKVVRPVPVTYTAYSGLSQGCTAATTPPMTMVRKFHDIARRTLFMAAVLNGTPLSGVFSTTLTE